MSILGYDCDGKPIRAGDKVRVIRYKGEDDDAVKDRVLAEIFTVVDGYKQTKAGYSRGDWVVLHACDLWFDLKSSCQTLRKIDQDQKTIPWSECVWQPKSVTA